MSTIYNIVGDIKALHSLIESMTDEETGEVRELSDEDRAVFIEWVQEQTEAFDLKFDRICKFYKNLRSEAAEAVAERDSLKEEMDRLSKRAKTRENKAERIKSLIWYALDSLKVKKHETALFSATVQNTAASLRVGDSVFLPQAVALLVPEEFRKPPEIDGKVVREALKAGDWTTNELGAVLDNEGKVIPGLYFLPGKTCVIR